MTDGYDAQADRRGVAVLCEPAQAEDIYMHEAARRAVRECVAHGL